MRSLVGILYVEVIMEVWKDIEGFENYYQISNLGRVKSLKRKRVLEDRILKPVTNNKGYLQVTLLKPNTIVNRNIHRILMLHFVDNLENKRCINHISGNKKDNRLENLEWVTHKENTQHALKNGLLNTGGNNNEKKVSVYNLNNEYIKSFDSITKASQWIVNRGASETKRVSVGAVCRGKQKTAYGYVWKFCE
jgi:hypothetical protein